MIPKIIHYCWFGKDEMPDNIKSYIKTWEEKCPDYKIIKWSEENFDVNMSKFSRQAYELKKYAFVSDYARFYALNKFGGIYMDTDMELLKPLDDFLNNDFFMGYEENRADSLITTCIIGSAAGYDFNRQVMDMYDRMDFIRSDGSYEMTPNTVFITDILHKKHGIKTSSEYEKDGVHIYPWDYFHPMSLISGKLNITDNTYAIHRHTLLWVSKKTRIIKFLRMKILMPLLGEERYITLTRKIKNAVKQ